jgi:hypothetical protein
MVFDAQRYKYEFLMEMSQIEKNESLCWGLGDLGRWVDQTLVSFSLEKVHIISLNFHESLFFLLEL